MTPQPVYCDLCGEYLRSVMGDRTLTPRTGQHRYLEDCVRELSRRLAELEDSPSAD